MTEDKALATVSIAICTRNRAHLLDGVLRTLGEQEAVNDEFEIVVVDNASTDSTESVVKAHAELGLPVRTVVEPKLGLSHARNRAVAETSAPFIAFVDDDCEIPPNWLASVLRLLAKHRPLALGGPFGPLYEGPAPRWYRDVYASRSLGEEPGWLPQDRFLIGCNLIVARQVLQRFRFNPDLGMAGDTIAYGEEVELQRLLDEHYGPGQRRYEPELTVAHLTRVDQLTLRWLLKSCFAKGRDVCAAAGGGRLRAGRGRALLDFVKTSGALVLDASVGALARNRRRYVFVQNYWYEHSGQYLKRLGRLSLQLGWTAK